MSDFYIAQSPTSNPRRFAPLFEDLTTDLPGIAQVTQGLVYHYFAGQYEYGWQPPQERMPEINTRTMERILAALMEKDSLPLTEERPIEDRLVGCCRDFSLLACAILRHQGRAARLRYGFGSYFDPGYWEDHVIVEVWNGSRWQRFDPQLAGKWDTDFDLFDMPEEAFATGGRAWQMARQEGADPARFGLGPGQPQVSGMWFIRERLQLDVAALNKIELLCWDGMEGLKEGVPADEAVLDEMATLSLHPDSSELRSRSARDERWQLPETVSCFHPMIGPAFSVAVAAAVA